MSALPNAIRSVFAARYPRTDTASCPHASLIHTESSPTSSPSRESLTCSSNENHGQYARNTPIRMINLDLLENACRGVCACLLDQQRLADLARGRERQLGAEDDLARHLVVRELPSAVLDELVRGR